MTYFVKAILVAAACLASSYGLPTGLRTNAAIDAPAEETLRFMHTASSQHTRAAKEDPPATTSDTFLSQRCRAEGSVHQIYDVLAFGRSYQDAKKDSRDYIKVVYGGDLSSSEGSTPPDAKSARYLQVLHYVPTDDARLASVKTAFKVLAMGLDANNADMPADFNIHIADVGPTVAYAYKKVAAGQFYATVYLGSSMTKYVPSTKDADTVRGGKPGSGSRTVAEQVYEYFDDVDTKPIVKDVAMKLLQDTKAVHELCHILHQVTAPDKYVENIDVTDAYAKEVAARGVSHYAGSKDTGFLNEFVAEVCAARVAGVPLPDWVDDVYQKAGGPLVTDDMKIIAKQIQASKAMTSGSWKSPALSAPVKEGL